MSTGLMAASIPTQTPNVEALNDALAAEIGLLHDNVDRLHARVSPVLRASEDPVPADSTLSGGNLSNVAQELHTRLQGIQTANARISEITSRIDV